MYLWSDVMLVRIGMYATYNGKDYKAAKVNDELYKLIDDGTQTSLGFKVSEFAPLVYIKIVQRPDLDRVYIVKTYADFQGERLEVAEDNNDTLMLATSDARVAQRLGMDKIDRYDYRLKVCKGEVLRIIEEIDQLD